MRSLVALAVLTGTAVAQTPPHFERIWGGETRQVFTLELGSGNRHVWTVGDGPLIRHAIDPGASTTWDVQAPPADVTQNLLDVHFIPGTEPSGAEHLGFAVGLNGHVLTSADYGATWVHLDSGEVENQLGLGENATLWRGRFTSEDNGFVCGLWTFQRWNGTTASWSAVDLLDQNNNPIDANRFEFYALELIVDPNNPDRWIGVAAGQRWGLPGGGHGDAGSVFYGNWSVNGGNTWKEVFRTEVPGLSYQDPWDVEFEPNPAQLGNSVGYLCVGTGTAEGAVFRTTNSGKTWNPTPDLAGAFTLYGIGVLNADEAVAAGYGGQVWVRDSSGTWTCRRGATCTLPSGVTQTHSAPLAGVHGEDPDVYVTGSFGYVHVSSDGFVTDSLDLEPSSSDDKSEHWRFADLDFTSVTRGYAVSANKTIIESTDGGVQWDLSASSPNGLLGPGSTEPLQAIDFRTGGGSGVAVGYGEAGSLATFTAPTLDQAFAYHAHETGSPSWTASQLAFSVAEEWLLLEDGAWASGDGSTAEFWAAGRSGDGNPYNPNNVAPALLRSTDGGATWTDGDAATGGSIPGTVRLNAIAFRSTSEGFVVGWNTATTSAVAYRIDLSGATPVLTSIAVPAGGSREMLDVTGNASFVAACGKHESLFVYNASVPEFALQSGLPDLGYDTPTDFLSIAAPPGSDLRLLIGARNSVAEADAPGLGKVLYYDAGWSQPPAGTNKSVVAIVLRDDGGFAIAGSGGVMGSSEVGLVADAAILRFVEP